MKTQQIRNFVVMFALVIVAMFAAACGHKCESGNCGSSTSPSTAEKPCTFAVSPTSQNFAYTGGDGSVAVATQSGCTWVPTASVSWIKITSTSNGSFAYTVQANPGAARSGTITVADKTVTITQDECPPACSFTLNPTSKHFPYTGGSGSFTVTVTGGCEWRPISDSPWIHVTSSQSCTVCNGTVTYTVDKNSGGFRTGHINVGSATHTVTQDGEPAGPPPTCTFSVSPTSRNFPYQGGNDLVQVSTQSGCNWDTRSNDSWITITGGSFGSGDGKVSYSVAANPGAARTGTMTIAGKTVTITQDGAPIQPAACSYSVATNAIDVDYRAANGTIAVGASPNTCTSNITSNVSWFRVVNGSGSGNWSTPFTIDENPGGVRNASITITGQNGFSKTIPVTQGAKPTEATCSYSFTVPDVFNAAKAGADGSILIGVNGPNPSTCTWTITTTQFWIGANPSSGAGNGSSKFTVGGNNTGAIRSGEVTVKGGDGSFKKFTVNQGG